MTTLRSRSLAVLAVTTLLALAVAAPPGAGQDNDAFPSVAGGGPPDWVTPGLRLSWYGEAASVRTSDYTYVEDEDGDWEDPVTHKRYRRTEEDEMPTAAGRAYTQSDVIAVDGDDVILGTTMIGIDMESGAPSIIPLWGGRYAGAAVDGAWVRPDLLAEVATGGTTELRVLRGAYDLWGTSVPAVAFMSKGEGSYASTVFDEASGALIASTSRAKGAGSPVHGPIDLPEGNVLIAWTRLAAVRQRDLPGLTGALPDWVVPGLVLRYTGSATVTNPFDPSGFSATWAVEASVTIEDTGAAWATYASTTSVDYDSYVDSSHATGATGAVGQYWYAPDGMAQLSEGDVLDDDPLTGAQLTVERVGADAVTLGLEMDGVAVASTYDRASGAMTAMTLQQGASTTQLLLDSID